MCVCLRLLGADSPCNPLTQFDLARLTFRREFRFELTFDEGDY